MTYQLIELTCSGCEKTFMVHLEPGEECLCGNCRAFRTVMERLMLPHKAPKKKMDPLLKGILWSLGLGLPIWITFLILWLR